MQEHNKWNRTNTIFGQSKIGIKFIFTSRNEKLVIPCKALPMISLGKIETNGTICWIVMKVGILIQWEKNKLQDILIFR